jgi:hypothetical protein
MLRLFDTVERKMREGEADSQTREKAKAKEDKDDEKAGKQVTLVWKTVHRRVFRDGS